MMTKAERISWLRLRDMSARMNILKARGFKTKVERVRFLVITDMAACVSILTARGFKPKSRADTIVRLEGALRGFAYGWHLQELGRPPADFRDRVATARRQLRNVRSVMHEHSTDNAMRYQLARAQKFLDGLAKAEFLPAGEPWPEDIAPGETVVGRPFGPWHELVDTLRAIFEDGTKRKATNAVGGDFALFAAAMCKLFAEDLAAAGFDQAALILRQKTPSAVRGMMRRPA